MLTVSRVRPFTEIRIAGRDPAKAHALAAGRRERVIASQFVHHGSDHRAHLGTILGARCVGPLDLDV